MPEPCPNGDGSPTQHPAGEYQDKREKPATKPSFALVWTRGTVPFASTRPPARDAPNGASRRIERPENYRLALTTHNC